jgi:hypothetical protein
LSNCCASNSTTALVVTSFSRDQEALVRRCRTYAVLMAWTLSGPFDIELIHPYDCGVTSTVPRVVLRLGYDLSAVRISNDHEGSLPDRGSLCRDVRPEECVQDRQACADYAQPHLKQSVIISAINESAPGTDSQMKFATIPHVPSVGIMFIPRTTCPTRIRLTTHTLQSVSTWSIN